MLYPHSHAGENRPVEKDVSRIPIETWNARKSGKKPLYISILEIVHEGRYGAC
jgi:hypothetical protein